ncbi:MAG: hypothetical protein VX435_09095 [Planctomycetota bacterium]|nr:hypothetical protein [Planctomycetota bacterium]|tara:strand:- start:24 stop:1091 length:1068 start_codon:yes stop_codon:yes gene_type:complete
MTTPEGLPRYDRSRDYEWNYTHAPAPVERDLPPVPGRWQYCGIDVDSPLGIPAGPLLNGRWCLYYASLGFDVVTYKTVRSGERSCYPLPNLQPISSNQLYGGEQDLPTSSNMEGSWAVSFGMPSRTPDIWRQDIEQTRRELPTGKLLSVSVVGTIEPGWQIDQLAGDYARCAKWALESGADTIEANFSCPNVSTCDGQLYQNPESARRVAQELRAAIGSKPLIVKIGRMTELDQASLLLDALNGIVNALAMTNSIATTVRDSRGDYLFDGQPRGICGDAIRDASIAQTRDVASLLGESPDMQLIGVGGISDASHVQDYLNAGAHAVQLASAPMVDPEIGIRIRKQLAGVAGSPSS